MIRNTLLIDDLSDYLDYKSTSLRAGSYKVYRNFGDKFRAYIEDEGLGRMMTKNVTPAICEAYRRHILKLHRTKPNYP